MEEGFYTYVLESIKDGKRYIGYTKNLKLRFEQHNRGDVESTRLHRRLKVITYDWCICQSDAMRREKYFKTHYGRLCLAKRLKSYSTGCGD